MSHRRQTREGLWMTCPDCKERSFSFAEYCRKCGRNLTRRAYQEVREDGRRRLGLFSVGVVK
jgi:predicted amidophosphoribosyltransferase